MKFFKRLLKPLQSRKVRVALVTVVVAYAAEYGLELNDAVLLAIVSTGIAVIGGIALEDAGQKAGAGRSL